MVIPNAPYEIAEKIGDFMEKDFTIFLRAKLNVKSLIPHREMYFFARNGQHCGLCAFIDHKNDLCVQCTYWFKDEDGIQKDLQIRYELPEQVHNEFNNYFITCNHEKKIISFYVNGVLAGELDYKNSEKLDYTNSFIWLGCANMMVNDEFNVVAEIEFNMFIALTKCLSVGDMYSLINNYKQKYFYKKFDYSLPVLSNNTPNFEHFKLFCDFEEKNLYKVWNLVNNGNFLQKYIKDNIYY
jgi:hypothetical protein